MARRHWAMIGAGVLVCGILLVDSFAGDIPPAAEKSKATNQVQKQGKQSKENDVQSRGLFSKKKKKKTDGGAAARSQPSDRTDPPPGDPAARSTP